jgi:hypothetical protein
MVINPFAPLTPEMLDIIARGLELARSIEIRPEFLAHTPAPAREYPQPKTWRRCSPLDVYEP